MIATLVVASFAWISSAVGPDGPVGPVAPASVSTQGHNQSGSIMRWAQQEDEPPIEQVGEDTGADVETLDEPAPAVEEEDPAADIELLDQGPTAEAQDDVELLDQGSPPAGAVESTAPATVTTEPVTTYVAPATTNGPVVPEGFGTGTVHVATGAAGFPVGLEDCHVGAVTGRAYVGIDCGDDTGNLVVGHAPSFEEFPFVLEENFPFARESVFADRGESQSDDRVVTLVSGAGGTTRDDGSAAPEIRTSGPATVEYEQRARDRKPRVEAGTGGTKRGKEKRRGENGGITATESQDTVGTTSADSKQENQKKGKDRTRRGPRADGDKKSTSAPDAKKDGAKKGKKKRAPN
jgi:hypothetical protein